MGPLIEFYLQKSLENIDGRPTEFVEDEVSHAEVDKGVASKLVLKR